MWLLPRDNLSVSEWKWEDKIVGRRCQVGLPVEHTAAAGCRMLEQHCLKEQLEQHLFDFGDLIVEHTLGNWHRWDLALYQQWSLGTVAQTWQLWSCLAVASLGPGDQTF